MKINQFLILLLTLMISLPGVAAGLKVPEIWTARQAIDFARQNSPDSQLAAQRMLQAEAMVQKAGVGFYPQLELFGNYSQTNNPISSFGNILNQGEFSPAIDFNNPGRTDDLELGVGVKYRFYNGGQDLAHKNAAKAGVNLSAAAREAVLLSLEFEVYRGFQRIVESGKVLQARQQALEAISSSLAVAMSRYDAGDLLKLDVLNLEVEQSQAREKLMQAQHNLELAKQIFLTLLGLSGDDLQIKTHDAEDPALPINPDPIERPELKKLTAALKAAEAQLAAAHGSRLPTVDGFARYQYDQGTIRNGHGDSWMAGVNLNFKLFDGYQSSAEIALSEAQIGALRAEQKKLELALNFEVTQAQLALELARQRLQVTEKTVEQAVESESLTQARFQAGVLLMSELIDSQNRLTDARVRHVLASSAVQIAIAELRRAAGLPQYTEDVNQTTNMESQP
ncbi:MAG: TolC family protein [Desulfuromonadales bacterium]|nr:TolC family protein [Desulfuromonadales bacterium]